MKKIIVALCFIVLFSSTAFAEENRAYFPPVLMYHDIKDRAQNEFDVLVKDFAEQLNWLKDNGYQTLSIEEFISYVKHGKKFPEKSVLITFDDGYSGVYHYAFPELKKRNMKAAVCIITDVIGVFTTVYTHVTERQLKNMANSGLISIASHTVSHPDFYLIDEKTRKKELENSKEILEKLTGKKIRAFVYPYGNYNKEIIKEVKSAGYETAFAVGDNGLCDEPARYSIPRIYMGLELCKDNQKLFKQYIQEYKNMPNEAFAERWKPLSSDLWRWQKDK